PRAEARLHLEQRQPEREPLALRVVAEVLAATEHVAVAEPRLEAVVVALDCRDLVHRSPSRRRVTAPRPTPGGVRARGAGGRARRGSRRCARRCRAASTEPPWACRRSRTGC